MWEGITYDYVLDDLLSMVPGNVDKREGSVIYDALAPCAYKIAEQYYYMDRFLDLVFADTATGEYLDRVVTEKGLVRKTATYSVRKIETSGAVNVGTRWGKNEVSYVITALLSPNEYSAQCEQTGEIGNTYSGLLDSIDNVPGITASLTDIIISGEDEESDDDLRSRFYAHVQSSGTSGNKFDYRNWALDVPGCGDAKVYPLWNGNGTVKVLVVDENMDVDATLPGKVSTYIETVRPIGAVVTVESPSKLTISVTANVKRDGTKTMADIQTAFRDSLAAYLRDTVFEIYSISYAKIGSILLSTLGVSDYNTLKVNTGTSNITISDTQMPICGTVTLTEVP